MDCQKKQAEDVTDDEHDKSDDGATNDVIDEEGVEHEENNQRINTVEQSLMEDIQIEDSIEELIEVNRYL